MRLVPVSLTKGYEALVDPEDAINILQHRWVADERIRAHGKVVYAYRTGKVGEKRTKIYMHRAIANFPEGMIVDHINGNGLHNYRKNLRITDYRGNALTAQLSALPAAIPLRGVTRQAGRLSKPYKARFAQNYLGMFASAEEAARAYDRYVFEKFGPLAPLNFPAEEYKAEVYTLSLAAAQETQPEDVPF